MSKDKLLNRYWNDAEFHMLVKIIVNFLLKPTSKEEDFEQAFHLAKLIAGEQRERTL